MLRGLLPFIVYTMPPSDRYYCSFRYNVAVRGPRCRPYEALLANL